MACCFLECSLVYPAEEDRDRYAEESILGYYNNVDYRKFKCILSVAKILALVRRVRRCCFSKGTRRSCRRCCWLTSIIILILLFATFIILFVILPLPFKRSIEFQRRLIFHPDRAAHSSYNMKDLYLSSNFTNGYWKIRDNLEVGMWNVSSTRWTWGRSNPTLIYFHNGIGDRRKHKDFCRVYSKLFNVIIFDYRSYGDSSTFDLVEDGLIDDAVFIYKWVLNKTKNEVYVWGNHLGAAIATHTVARLQNDSIVPTGLILENPFTSLSESITMWYWPLGVIFSWMPWYDSFVTKPLIRNRLSFNVSSYITKVDCPILVLRPYRTHIVDKVSTVAANREPLAQGSVTVYDVYWNSGGSYFDPYNTYDAIFVDFIAECGIYKQNHPTTNHSIGGVAVRQ